MTNFEDKPPPAVGAYWIKEEDYPALLNIFDDGDKLPPSWKEWLKMAEEMEQGSRPMDTSCCAFPSTPPRFRVVRRPWHAPGQCRTQKVRRGGGNREIRRSNLIDTAA